ncbi:MAG: glycosyltransferase family 9 protein, partial [Acetobacteraceae bacterium]|nr:glycosyltransferase family 9 protein [Acetobacteraceae bacterium]
MLTLRFFAQRADGEHPGFDQSQTHRFLHEHWDLAIDLRVDADTRIVLCHLPATFRVGFESPDYSDRLTMAIPHAIPRGFEYNIGLHQSLLMLRLVRSVADLFGPREATGDLLRERLCNTGVDAVDLSPARGRLLVACNPTSGRALKNWPLERFARLVGWLARELDVAVLLLGGRDDAAAVAQIVGHCGSANIISAVGRTTLPQSVGLLAEASMFVGNDSGLAQIAARLGLPTVVIFSGVDPTSMWVPLGPRVTALKAPVACSPCNKLQESECYGERACTLNISEQGVRAAVRKHLLT